MTPLQANLGRQLVGAIYDALELFPNADRMTVIMVLTDVLCNEIADIRREKLRDQTMQHVISTIPQILAEAVRMRIEEGELIESESVH